MIFHCLGSCAGVIPFSLYHIAQPVNSPLWHRGIVTLWHCGVVALWRWQQALRCDMPLADASPLAMVRRRGGQTSAHGTLTIRAKRAEELNELTSYSDDKDGIVLVSLWDHFCIILV